MEAFQQRPEHLNKAVASLCARIELLLKQNASRQHERVLTALASVPGSGKSTVSAALLKALRSQGNEDIVVVPMDGFHYSTSVLFSFDDPALAFRKRGAPFTFDAAGLLELVLTLKTIPVTTDEHQEMIITAPSFDHGVQDPVLDDIHISSKSKVVIMKGNYTLLNQSPWDEISELVDDRWFVVVPAIVARERLIERHLRAGIETSREAAALRAEDNDIPNGDLIGAALIEPSVRITN
ncbi:Uu.00g117900.m01.CDS01 [Anthostomella pinea]|uniref:Uu.00g117900.m01.CDS01 n=1 Tax=Anthostomella pinea TaxID=933095 RepID=A0AAI8YGZ9_9PEZI|nr:Uu.00g117900.m01.CDS01 [Anthostomella pinea]